MKEHNLLNSPAQLYNVDESGIPLDPKSPRVVTVKGTKKYDTNLQAEKDRSLLLHAGQVLPPLVIYDAKKVRAAWTRHEVPGTKYGTSDKGWISTELFESWFFELFVPNAVAARPFLLLLDGHSTHYQLEVIKLAIKMKLLLCACLHIHHMPHKLLTLVYFHN